MTKNTAKYIEILAILLTVALAPASVAFAQTTTADAAVGADDTTDNTDSDGKKDTRSDEEKRKEKLKEHLKQIRENIVKRKTASADDVDKTKSVDKARTKIVSRTQDGVSEVREKIVDRTQERRLDRAADLTYHGKTSGWTILGGTAFPSSIGISGQGYNQGSGNWKITAVGDITVADRTAKLDLTGHVRENTIVLKGTGTLSDDAVIDIYLKGHIAPTSSTNEMAIAFTNSYIQYKDTGQRIPLMQVGSVTIAPIVSAVPVEPVPTTPAQ